MALKEEDKIKEPIRYNTELVKLSALFLIAAGGGVLTLTLGRVDTGGEVVFTAVGMILALLCVVVIYQTHRVIKKLIDNGK